DELCIIQRSLRGSEKIPIRAKGINTTFVVDVRRGAVPLALVPTVILRMLRSDQLIILLQLIERGIRELLIARGNVHGWEHGQRRQQLWFSLRDERVQEHIGEQFA